MRNFDIFGSDTRTISANTSSDKSELLRRKTISSNAHILIVAALVAMPVAVWCLVGYTPLPFIVATLGLLGGMVSLTLFRHGHPEHAVAAQIATLVGTGLMLSALDMNSGDAGLVLVLLGPVLAGLLASKGVQRLSWLGVAIALVIAIWGIGPVALLVADSHGTIVVTALCALLGAMVLMVHTAHRINSAYVVQDKAQANAYLHLIEHVQDAVVRYSSRGEILSASRSIEALFCCPRYHLSAAGLDGRLHVQDRPLYRTALVDACQRGKNRTVEVRMRRDESEAGASAPNFIWVDICFSPIGVGSGESPHEVIAMMRDITERKDSEAMMRAARHAAEEASEAKSRFLAMMGHELRTPLNAIVGFSDMMVSGIGGEMCAAYREYAGLINQSGRHLLDVVGMLLDMSRIDAGKFEIEATLFQPDEIVPACFSMVETMAKEHNVALSAEIEPDLPQILADEPACRQILINLLSNGIKFSHDGGAVTLSVKRQGQQISFAVSDHGIGMAPMAIERIGEPFFQVENGLARQYEGTGLGLSIVKGLVDLHDGSLRAMSEIGAGTTVTVLLPINGPTTKLNNTGAVLPLVRESSSIPKSSTSQSSLPSSSWQNEKRKVQ